MTLGTYRFELEKGVDQEEAERTLQLAILGAEGLYGPARVRLDAWYRREPARRALVVDATTEVGAAVVRIFTSYLTREFGEESFSVRRLPDPAPSGPVQAPTGGRS